MTMFIYSLLAVSILLFDGSTKFWIVEGIEDSEIDEVSLRFKTGQRNTIIFRTDSTSADKMQLELEEGVLKLSVNLGAGKKVSTSFNNFLINCRSTYCGL